EPFDDARLEGEAFGLGARQTAVMLGNGGSLVEMRSPVVTGPNVQTRAKQCHDACLVVRQLVEDRGRRWRRSFQNEVIAVECDLDARSSGSLQGFHRAHIRVLQPRLSGPDWVGKFASA